MIESSPLPFQIAHADSAAHARPGRADRAARLVSLVFSPPVLFVAAGMLVAFLLPASAERRLALLHTFGTVALPLLLLLILRRQGRISDFDLSIRRERLLPMAATQAGIVAGWVVLLWLHAPPLLQAFALLQLVQGAIFLLITFFWKISLHSAAIATLAVLATWLLPVAWLIGLLWLLVVTVAWARVHLRRHTPAQTVAGIGLALIVWGSGWLLLAGG
jgi:membrane-associated phospholipid phosphatase